MNTSTQKLTDPIDITRAQRAEFKAGLEHAMRQKDEAEKQIQQFSGSLAALDLLLKRFEEAKSVPASTASKNT